MPDQPVSFRTRLSVDWVGGLIYVNTRRYATSSLLLGSTATKVVHISPVPVLLVK
jgi:nucleotide-binding universal stress UspA family protein